jgi:hypothetical protein
MHSGFKYKNQRQITDAFHFFNSYGSSYLFKALYNRKGYLVGFYKYLNLRPISKDPIRVLRFYKNEGFNFYQPTVKYNLVHDDELFPRLRFKTSKIDPAFITALPDLDDYDSDDDKDFYNLNIVQNQYGGSEKELIHSLYSIKPKSRLFFKKQRTKVKKKIFEKQYKDSDDILNTEVIIDYVFHLKEKNSFAKKNFPVAKDFTSRRLRLNIPRARSFFSAKYSFLLNELHTKELRQYKVLEYNKFVMSKLSKFSKTKNNVVNPNELNVFANHLNPSVLNNILIPFKGFKKSKPPLSSDWLDKLQSKIPFRNTFFINYFMITSKNPLVKLKSDLDKVFSMIQEFTFNKEVNFRNTQPYTSNLAFRINSLMNGNFLAIPEQEYWSEEAFLNHYLKYAAINLYLFDTSFYLYSDKNLYLTNKLLNNIYPTFNSPFLTPEHMHNLILGWSFALEEATFDQCLVNFLKFFYGPKYYWNFLYSYGFYDPLFTFSRQNISQPIYNTEIKITSAKFFKDLWYLHLMQVQDSLINRYNIYRHNIKVYTPFIKFFKKYSRGFTIMPQNSLNFFQLYKQKRLPSNVLETPIKTLTSNFTNAHINRELGADFDLHFGINDTGLFFRLFNFDLNFKRMNSIFLNETTLNTYTDDFFVDSFYSTIRENNSFLSGIASVFDLFSFSKSYDYFYKFPFSWRKSNTFVKSSKKIDFLESIYFLLNYDFNFLLTPKNVRFLDSAYEFPRGELRQLYRSIFLATKFNVIFKSDPLYNTQFSSNFYPNIFLTDALVCNNKFLQQYIFSKNIPVYMAFNFVEPDIFFFTLYDHFVYYNYYFFNFCINMFLFFV